MTIYVLIGTYEDGFCNVAGTYSDREKAIEARDLFNAEEDQPYDDYVIEEWVLDESARFYIGP